jgi:D-arabinose 1-dehydrogenase-like Zn-dependent alcohol dehydrogenase
MKAAVLREIGKPLRIEDVPVPQIGPDEVLVETRTCGICRTDLHITDGLAYVPELPHIPGHEPAGVVAGVGENVSGLQVGQRVVPYLFLSCGQCAYCRVGRDALCTNLKGVLGVTVNGGFAEYFVAPARNVFPLPDNVSFEKGGLTSCAVITALHAFRRSRLGPNDAAVLVGAGGVAQPLIQLLKAAGVRVIAVSRSEEKLSIARQLGADWVRRADAPSCAMAKQIREFAGGDGAACVYDCVGSSSTMNESASFVRRGGQIIVLGEEPEVPSVDTIQIAQRELEIIGSRNGSRQDFVDAIAMLASGMIAPPVARTFPLEQINEALHFVRSGQAHARVVITV